MRRNLADVARDLRIRHIYLEAIEDGRFEDLPGLAYQSGFLRAYGNYLGLDGTALADRLRMARGSTAERGDLQVFSPIDEGHLPTRSVLILAALLAVAVYGVWYFLANTEGDPVERVAALPDRLAGLLEGKTEGGAEVAASDPADRDAPVPAPQPTARGPDDARDSGNETTVATVTQPEAPALEPAAPPDPAPEPIPGPPEVRGAAAPEERPAGEPLPAMPAAEPSTEALASPLPALAPPLAEQERDAAGAPGAEAAAAVILPSLELRALTDSWIEIRSGTAPPLYSGLLREGESFAVPERQGLRMITGNAGGLEILVDGREMPRLGPPGAVIRDIDLDELRRGQSG